MPPSPRSTIRRYIVGYVYSPSTLFADAASNARLLFGGGGVKEGENFGSFAGGGGG